ncbi:MAG TPA: hypothetical protein VF017_15780 [Thermoanaerobaculia bacterium]|nr:hypothetical protein [Thermoanaerobaculia bacterium]
MESRRRAHGLWRELARVDKEHRPLLVANQNRFTEWGLAELLTEKAREALAGDPDAAEHHAALVLMVCAQLDPPGGRLPLLRDLEAQAWALAGASRAARGEHAAAGDAFRRAAGALAQGSGDPLLRADLLELRAPWLLARGRRQRAELALREAQSLCTRAGESGRAGRCADALDELDHPGEPVRFRPTLAHSAGR